MNLVGTFSVMSDDSDPLRDSSARTAFSLLSYLPQNILALSLERMDSTSNV